MTGSSPAKHIRMLRRRAAWLQNRINTTTHPNVSYDKAEIEALTWAVERLEEQRLIAHRVQSEKGKPHGDELQPVSSHA